MLNATHTPYKRYVQNVKDNVFLQSLHAIVLKINGDHTEESSKKSNVYKKQKRLTKKMSWRIKKIGKGNLKKPVLVEGLPGIGNVGKIAVDFLIDSLDAKKMFEITSYDLPHCVFVNDDNVMELPSIDIYSKEVGGRTLLMLAGDIQPTSENSCYAFCEHLLDTFEKEKLQEIITLGGIALPEIPNQPKVHCTGNSKKVVQKYTTKKVQGAEGFVGPIIGVSGLLPGLAGKRKIPSAALLAETFGHPNYLGVKGAKELLRVLNKELRLKLNVNQLSDEMEAVEKEVTKVKKIKKAVEISKQKTERTDYIG